MLEILVFIFFLPLFGSIATGILRLLGLRMYDDTAIPLGIFLSGIVYCALISDVSENVVVWSIFCISSVLALGMWWAERKESQSTHTSKQQVQQSRCINNSNPANPQQTLASNVNTHSGTKVAATTTRRAETVPYPNYLDYENCMYCHQPVTPATAEFLTNGMKLHKSCYDKCLNSNGVVEKDVIGKAHAFWPGYPPDWGTRKAGVLREANYCCQICGLSGVALDVHHIVPLAKGGTNEFGNLKAICHDCHQAQHANHDLTRNFDSTPQQIKKVVYDALSQKRELNILYEDKYHNITQRRVRPKRIINRYGKQVLIAYCYLRQEDNREFRLERMRSAQLI